MMEEEYIKILEKLGYDVILKGSLLFVDLLVDCCEMVKNNKTDDEIRELLPIYYLENYHFYYGIGRKIYMAELDRFCNSRVVNDENENFNIKMCMPQNNMNLEDSLIFFARYFNKLEDENQISNGKRKVLEKK